MEKMDELLWEIMADWEIAYRKGNDISAEQLCQDHPELLEEVGGNIRALKQMDWLLKKEEDAEPACHAPGFAPFNIAGYTVIERLGSGGFGVVFKALHRRMERIVALKLLNKTALASQDAIQRFQQEIKAAAKLSHRNIATAHDAGEHDGHPYLVLELIEGIDLFRHVQEHGPLPVAKAVDYALQVAWGLEYAHSKGIWHLDIKPGNVVLASDGTVKILDLGLARFTRSADEVGKPEAFMGTADFVAPERTHDPKQADHRTDVYGLGCTLFFLLTGRPMYEGATVVQKILAHRESPIPSLPQAPQALNAVFQKMVAKKPADRYQSMTEVIGALQGSLKDRPPPKRRTFIWISAAVILGLAVAGYSFFSKTAPDTTKDRTAAEWVLKIGGKVTVKLLDGGTVPITNQLPAKPFTVQSINFSGNPQVTDADLERLQGLEELTDLNLHRTRITDKGTEHLQAMKNLRVLRLNETGITDKGLENLAGLTHIEMLELWGTAISNDGLKHLSKMQNLTWLILADTKIGNDGLVHLRALPNLRHLRLARLRITDAGAKHLAELKELRLLEIYETQVSDGAIKDIKGLKHLASLNLVRTKITDACVDDLAEMQSLRQLNLGGTKITLDGLERLQNALPDCKVTK